MNAGQLPVLLTIDVQRDFYVSDSPAQVDGTAGCLPQMQLAAAGFRSAQLPIVHVVRLYAADGSNAEPVRRDLVRSTSVVWPHTNGSQIAPELLPDSAPPLDPDVLLAGEMQQIGPSEWIMYKSRWGAFYATPLESHLRALGVTTVAVVGCNFPNCPRTTIYEASERDFATLLVADAVSGTYDRGLTEIANIGTQVVTAEGLLDAVSD